MKFVSIACVVVLKFIEKISPSYPYKGFPFIFFNSRDEMKLNKSIRTPRFMIGLSDFVKVEIKSLMASQSLKSLKILRSLKALMIARLELLPDVAISTKLIITTKQSNKLKLSDAYDLKPYPDIFKIISRVKIPVKV
jgi:hypothetical protein